jgi:hypothetical protein
LTVQPAGYRIEYSNVGDVNAWVNAPTGGSVIGGSEAAGEAGGVGDADGAIETDGTGDAGPPTLTDGSVPGLRK